SPCPKRPGLPGPGPRCSAASRPPCRPLPGRRRSYPCRPASSSRSGRNATPLCRSSRPAAQPRRPPPASSPVTLEALASLPVPAAGVCSRLRKIFDRYIRGLNEEFPVVEGDLVVGRLADDDRVVVWQAGIDCRSVVVVGRNRAYRGIFLASGNGIGQLH